MPTDFEDFPNGKAQSLDEVRCELRKAIFWTAFTSGMYSIERRTVEQENMRQASIQFIIFGVNARLLARSEAVKWEQAVWEKEDCPSLAEMLAEYGDGPAQTEQEIKDDFNKAFERSMRPDADAEPWVPTVRPVWGEESDAAMARGLAACDAIQHQLDSWADGPGFGRKRSWLDRLKTWWLGV